MKTSATRPSDEGSVTTSHRLKWGPLPPNEIGRIAQHLKKGEERICCPWSHGVRPKKLFVCVAVPLASILVPSQRPLAPSVASVTSVANDKEGTKL